MELLVIIAVSAASSLLTHVVIHRIRVATRRNLSGHRDKCWAIVDISADGITQALCLRAQYHRGPHAASLADLNATGYEKRPF